MPRTVIARRTIRTGDDGIRDTLYAMWALARQSLTSPEIRRTAVDIAAGEAPGRLAAIVTALDLWARDRFHFMRDPYRIEQLHRPEWMLAQMRERGKILVDCDDAALLMAALGESIGVAARFVAVAFFDPRADFSHVWTELYDGHGWRVIDPTRGAQPLDMRLVTRIMLLDV